MRILLLALAGGLAPSSPAQNCLVSPPSSLGTVAVLAAPCPSGGGALPNTTCFLVEVDCAGLLPAITQVRVTEPAAGLLQRGTVVFGTGGGGGAFYGESPGGLALFQTLVGLGYRVVDRAWAGPQGWTGGGAGGLRAKSSRYATLLTWIHGTFHSGGAFCASGNSGGAAEIGYALTTWGRAALLDLAVPTSGPAVARLDYNCPVPPTPEWAALCPAIVPPGAMACAPACSFGAAPNANAVCVACTPDPTLQDLRADSVHHEGALLAYPSTRVHWLFGALDCGESVPVALVYANAIATESIVEFVPDTPHAMFSTPQGREAIRAAIARLPRLLASGDPSPGGAIELHAFGSPASPVLLFLGVPSAPYSVPGFHGEAGIVDPAWIDAGTIGASESHVFSFPLPPGLLVPAPTPLHLQAVASLTLTNVAVVTLVP